MNAYVWVIWDIWNDAIVHTHRGRSAWSKRGLARRALENWVEKGHAPLVPVMDHFEVRKAVMAVLP